MRKSISRILLPILLLGLLLTGCKEEPDNSLPQVGIFLKDKADQKHNRWKSQLETDGYQVNLFTAPVDQAQQINQISECIQEEYSLLIVDPVINAAAEDICRPALEANIPIIIIDYEYAFPSLSGLVCFVGKNPSAPGLLQGELAQTLPNKGDLNQDGTVSYSVIAGPEDLADVQAYISGVQQTMKNETHLDTRYNDGTLEKAYNTCTSLLSEFGRDLEVILCSSPEIAEGVCKAATDAGRIPGKDVYILAVGLTDSIRDHIRSGKIFGTVTEDQEGTNEKILAIAQAMLNGSEYESQFFASHKPLTQEDLQ